MSLFTVLFSDDTNIILSGPNLHELQKLANETLITIMDYMSANKLTLNAKKTVALLFTPRNKPILPLSLKIGNTIIEQVNETKFLGVTIDDKLKFNTHFNNATSKIKQGIGALSQTKHLLSYQAKIKIYHGLIHSHLSYCPLIWLQGQPLKNLKLLQTLQKKQSELYSPPNQTHTLNPFSIYLKLLKLKTI